MKELKGVVNQVVNDSYKTADCVNHEGFAAWKQSDKEALFKYAMTGSLGHSFYCSQKDVVVEVDQLLQRSDAKDLSEAIVIGRNEGFIRAFPILGLVYLSTKDTNLFKSTFDKIIKTGNDLIDFIEICKSIRGLGRSIKTAINNWIKNNTNEYYAMKYHNQIADAIRLTRFHGDDPIYSYILKKYSGRIKSFDQSKYEKAFEKYPILDAHRNFLKCIEEDNFDEALSLIKNNRFDVDSLTSCYNKFNEKIWVEIAKLTPVMRFIKYLNKFDEVGVFKSNIDIVKSKITVDNLMKAKVFPFRLYVAFLNCYNQDVRDHLADVMDEYVSKYDWSNFNKYSWIIAPDVSGSMNSRINYNDEITFSALSGMFVGFFRKGIDKCNIIPWDTQTYKFNLPKKDSVLTHIKEIKRMCGGGTSMEVAVDYCIANKIKADRFVFITDTEEYGAGWIQSWKKYKLFNKNAKAFLLRSDSYVHNPVSESDAEKYDVYQVFSWNDNAIKFIECNI